MKQTVIFLILLFGKHFSIAQVSISIDTLEISQLKYIRSEIMLDSVEYTNYSEYERPDVRVSIHINGIDESCQLNLFNFYGYYKYHNRIIKSNLYLNHYDKSNSRITLVNPNFFDKVLYQTPVKGIEDYTKDILELIDGFKVRIEIRDDILIAESEDPAIIILRK